MFIYFYLFYFIILPHRINYCGGEISKKQSLWGIYRGFPQMYYKKINKFVLYTPRTVF